MKYAFWAVIFWPQELRSRIFLTNLMHWSRGIRRIIEVPKFESSCWGTMPLKCKNQQFHYLQACIIAVPICTETFASHRGNRCDADCVGSIVAQVPLPPSPIPLSGHISGFWAAHWNWKELLRTQLDCARHRAGWSRQGGSGRRKAANPHLLHFNHFVVTISMNKLTFHGCKKSLQTFSLPICAQGITKLFENWRGLQFLHLIWANSFAAFYFDDDDGKNDKYLFLMNIYNWSIIQTKFFRELAPFLQRRFCRKPPIDRKVSS